MANWLGPVISGLASGVGGLAQGYEEGVDARKARAKQNFDLGMALLNPDIAASAFDEMQAPDPVSRWLGSAMGQKLPDTSKERAALGKYLAMKQQEMEAALLKAQMVGLKNPMRLAPATSAMPPAVAPVQPLPLGGEAGRIPAIPSPMGPPVDAMEPPPAATTSPMGPPVDAMEPPPAATMALTPPPPPPNNRTPVRGDIPDVPASQLPQPLVGQQVGESTYVTVPGIVPVGGPGAPTKGRLLDRRVTYDPSFGDYVTVFEIAPPAPVPLPPREPAPPAPAAPVGNYVLPGVTINPMGLREPGNIDLDKREVVKNPDGSISTVKSFSTEIDGKEVLLPMVIDGKTVSEADAVKHFFKTGEHLGKFATPEAATDYAKRLHEQQATAYGQPQQAPAPAPPVAQAPPAPVAPAEPALILPTGPIPVAGKEAFGEEPIDQRTALAIQRQERAKGYTGADVTTDFSAVSKADAAEYMAVLDKIPDIKGPGGADPHYEWVPDEATDREKYVEVTPGMTRPGKTKDGKSRDKEWISIGYDDNGNEIEQYVWKDDQMPAPGPGNKPVANRLKKPKPTAPGARKRGYKSFGYTPNGKKEIFKYVYDDSDLPAPGPGGKPMPDQLHNPRERQEDPAAKASRDLLNYTRIGNALDNEFPMAINSASPGWGDKMRKRQKLLKRMGLPDDTGIPEPGKGVLDRLMEED